MPSLLARAARPLARRGFLPGPPAVVHAPLPDTRAIPRTALDADANLGTALFRFPQRRGVLPDQARAFYETNEWCRACVDRLIGRVARAERLIEPINPDKGYSKGAQQRLQYLIENPNPRGDSFRSFMEPVLKDVLTLGKGGWEYVANWRGWPVALYPFNAEYMSVNADWDGSKPREPRYFWTPVPRQSLPLLNEEITLMLWSPSTHRPDGLSPLDTLKASIEADAAGSDFVRSMLQKYPPPGWLHLGESAGRRQVLAAQQEIQSNVLGKGGWFITGGLKEPKFQSLWDGNSKDNELMAWSIYFARKICAVYGVSPQELGITHDINKATAESQQDISDETGYMSLLQFTEEYINRELFPRFGGTPEELNLRFRFLALTLGDQERRVELARQLVASDKGVPLAKLNEGRKIAGLQPVEGGNVLFAGGAGATALLGEDAPAHRQRMADEAAAQLDTHTKIEAANAPDDDDPASKKEAA